jgi:hypothetical protein
VPGDDELMESNKNLRFTFFVGTIKDFWSSGQWAGLLSRKVFFFLGRFVFSFFIPKFIERLKSPQMAGIV